MAPENAGTVPATLLQGRFSGRSEFSDTIRQAFSAAAAQGWHEIILCDPDFSDWPLGECVLARALNDWSRTGRKLTLLAQNYDEVLRKHARFVAWRRTWAHIVECRSSIATPADSMPSAFWSADWVFERLDLQRCCGLAGSEPGMRVALRERLNERLLRSSPAFAATTLGL